MSRRGRALLQCAPISPEKPLDRPLRRALDRAQRNPEGAEAFAIQQKFDAGLAGLARALPIPPDAEQLFANEKMLPAARWSWRKIARDPAILSVTLALTVIAGVFVFLFTEHITDFPGGATARKLLNVASSTRTLLLDPVQTDAGSLGDLFFMKNRLEHYDVPPEFADFRTFGCRVFDDDEAHRVAQIWVIEKNMQFFLFPGEKDASGSTVPDFSDWRLVEQEGWNGAVQQRNGVCFMAALRGPKEDLKQYLAKRKG